MPDPTKWHVSATQFCQNAPLHRAQLNLLKIVHNIIICIVDLWDGQTDPIIYHGLTLTSKIKLVDVVQVIASNAFEVTP